MTKFTNSLVISTYNWPEALELCLKSLLAQTKLPDEVLIADDGSSLATKDVVEKYKVLFPVAVHHIWHEDNGFQLAKIRNKAIAAAKGEYVIQIDGDQILHKKFIQDHLRFAKPCTFVRASRAYMNKRLSEQLLKNKTTNVSCFNKGLSNVLSAVHVQFLWPLFEYKYKAKEVIEIHGSNMAFWRADAIRVNGYNETFEGWGPEDKEFIVRLMHSGIQKRFLKLGAIAFHIYHAESSRNNLSKNEFILQEAVLTKKKFCESGINQYL
ncbi:glycosyltransferase family 2 protein [Desertivirga xinjiangensis]|uniref:glycosyltransferase family 2 protein n=1 Tax=Desertivirga xinjiangensis TaxID=539206 RepID=UPI00210A7719|nr:glycosyltransferase family 2 protein [Pedobacter xinjiangensis]